MVIMFLIDTLKCIALFDSTKSAISLLGGLELDQLGLDKFVTSDANYKFLNIVADGSSVNRLAVRMITNFRVTANWV